MKRMHVFNHAMKGIKQEHPKAFRRDTVIHDLTHVTAHFLIQNINLAFKAEHQVPKKYRPGFCGFLHYVLPYRTSREPLEFGNRKKQFKKYQWVHKRLGAGQPLQDVVRSVLDSMDLHLNMDSRYPGVLSGKQVEKTHFGLCSDLVNYAVNAFRAVGIPASYDFTPHYGNHYRDGHSWLVIHQPNGLLAIDVVMKNRLNKLYRKASLPKIYRYAYKRNSKKQAGLSPFWKDVTGSYKPPNRISIDNRWNRKLRGKDIYLTVFDLSNIWSPVAKAESVDPDSIFFTNVGDHIVYMAGYYDKSKKFHPINYPFIVNGSQQVTYLDPAAGGQVDSAVLVRKYPPFFIRAGKRKLQRIKGLNKLTFQASNSRSFIPHHTILSIHHFNSTHVQTIPLTYKGKYKYYRMVGPDSMQIFLATLRIKSKQQHAKASARNRAGKFSMKQLTDDNPLTYQGGRELEIRYTFPQPVKVSAIQLQPRNDDNHIDAGDRYELLIWNKRWKSLGTKVAKDTMLVYHNLPKNGLYWLRDLTKGREEEVFTFTDKGIQWWPGVSNYTE
jgi:hypothetical protein